MANHARVKLPWTVDPDIMELFAREAMRAAFGGFYKQDDERGVLSFSKDVGDSGGATNVWSDSGRHVEMRHGCQGLDMVAQSMEFEALCACFGSSTASDDGIGGYLLEAPGLLRLATMRPMCGGLGPRAPSDGPDGVSLLLGHMLGSGGRAGMWMLGMEEQKAARSLLDPMFFNPPIRASKALSSPSERTADYERVRAMDVVDWGSRLDWAAAVDAAYPQGLGMGAHVAANALLPAAALGIACPAHALEKSGVTGLERALSVALLWLRADTAKQLHGRLIEASAHPDASEAKAKALCDRAIERGARVNEGRPIPQRALASEALYEALVMGRQACLAKPAKAQRPGL